jgi:hypothetical protein
MRFASPGTIHELHAGKFLQRQTAPDSFPAVRPRSALGLSSELIAEHSPLAGPVVAHHMGTQEPLHAVVLRDDRSMFNRRRTHQLVNLFWRLFGNERRTTHFLSQDIAATPSPSRSVSYNTVILESCARTDTIKPWRPATTRVPGSTCRSKNGRTASLRRGTNEHFGTGAADRELGSHQGRQGSVRSSSPVQPTATAILIQELHRLDRAEGRLAEFAASYHPSERSLRRDRRPTISCGAVNRGQSFRGCRKAASLWSLHSSLPHELYLRAR